MRRVENTDEGDTTEEGARPSGAHGSDMHRAAWACDWKRVLLTVLETFATKGAEPCINALREMFGEGEQGDHREAPVLGGHCDVILLVPVVLELGSYSCRVGGHRRQQSFLFPLTTDSVTASANRLWSISCTARVLQPV